MSDWTFLNKHRCRTPGPYVPARYLSDDSYGFCGMFRFPLDGKLIRAVASDGEGWQHVSVTEEGNPKPPTWSIMCKVRDLFWEAEDVVVQFHPRKSEYVNNHPGCLHMWRCTDREFPTPPSIFVGLKGVNIENAV